MDAQYTQRLKKIEAVLKARLPLRPDAVWIAETFGELDPTPPAELVQTLTRPAEDLLNRGGKRWRPLLMTLICETLGGGDAALPLTPLVEFPHTGSLIHDDIEDNSDERRGKPAIHVQYGLDTGVNSGSFLYFLPLVCLRDWDAPAERKNQVYQTWGEHLRRIHLGQAMDIAWHRDYSSLPSVAEYELMCRLKTGVLARMAAELGVYAAPAATHGLARVLGIAAENLGVGFQILDDVRNLRTGNPGKKRGDDVVEGKKSLPVILYLHQQADQGGFVERCFSAARAGGTASREVEELIAALERAGTVEAARARGAALIAEAAGVLAGTAFDGYPVDVAARRLLAGMPELIR